MKNHVTTRHAWYNGQMHLIGQPEMTKGCEDDVALDCVNGREFRERDKDCVMILSGFGLDNIENTHILNPSPPKRTSNFALQKALTFEKTNEIRFPNANDKLRRRDTNLISSMPLAKLAPPSRTR